MENSRSDEENYSDFCCEMRIKTKNIHDQSDKLINLKLAAVLTDTKLWSDAVTEFYFVFRSIEFALEKRKDDPRIGVLYTCCTSELRRTEAFQADLQHYLGDNWHALIRPSDVVGAYCARIEEVADDNPVLLIAYVHSMYLALLAGGMILKRIVKKTLGLSGKGGLSLFDFGDANRTEMRASIVNVVNSIELTRQEKDEIVKEKITIFLMNNAIANNFNPSWWNYRRLAQLFVLVGFAGSLTAFVVYRIISNASSSET